MDQSTRFPLVSVIIPTYNREFFIGQAVRSVLRQSYSHLEVIVIDDCSTDRTQDIITDFCAYDQRVRYFKHGTNRGSQASRNTGIQESQGVYVAFLDSDNIWLPDKLKKQMDLFEQSTDSLGVVYCGYRRIATDTSTREIMPKFRGEIYESALLNWIADTSTLVVRKDVLEKAGGFDERVRAYQEWDLCIRLACWTDFDFVPEPMVLYAAHDGARISNDRILNTLGRLDVVEVHRDEIVAECGNSALSKQYWMIGWIFIDQTKRYDLARWAFWKAWRVDSTQLPTLICFFISWLGKAGHSCLELQRHRFRITPMVRKS